MSIIDEVVGEIDSVRVTPDDFEKAEKLGYDQKPTSTVLSDTLQDSVQLQKIREQKKEELKQRIEEIRSDCRLFGINFSEIR